MSMPEMPKWYGDDGQIVSCTEKVKVMVKTCLNCTKQHRMHLKTRC